MSENPPENSTTPQPDANPENPLFTEIRDFLSEELGKIKTDLRSELVHTSQTPAAEAAKAAEKPPEDGAYCNQCANVSRPETPAEGSKESVLAEAGHSLVSDVLWALDHNATFGHHVTVALAEKLFQFAPRLV